MGSTTPQVLDPLQFVSMFWPKVRLYKQQEDLLYSVRDNDETICVAGNMLGKDFIAGLAVLYFFLSRHPCRIVTTSADHNQLKAVLWGEIRRFIQTAARPLTVDKGGPLLVNELHIRKVVNGNVCGISYILGRTAAKGEGLLGHHVTPESGAPADGIPRTLFVADEASGVDQESYIRGSTWMKRFLAIGNPYPCNNFFKSSVKEGDILAPDGDRYYRKVVRIKAEDSPNVRYAEALKGSGKLANDREAVEILPGVLSYPEYRKRRKLWDKVRQCVSLDASFYEGADVLLFPPDWLDKAETRFRELYRIKREAKAIGVDPAEGGDKTSMCAIDEHGIVEIVSKHTRDTAAMINEVIGFMRKHGVPGSKVCIDRGGGGKQVADQLRERGWDDVRTIGFGDPVTLDPQRGMVMFSDKAENREDRTAYVNRRAEMFYEMSALFDPSLNENVFAIPRDEDTGLDLRAQLSPLPKMWDREGKLYLLPKNRKPGSKDKSVVTLIDLIGHSPDEADSLALAIHAMHHKTADRFAGAA